MGSKAKLIILELVSGLFGWLSIGASIAGAYFLVMAIFFEGEWSSLFWALGVGGISKMLFRGFETARRNANYS